MEASSTAPKLNVVPMKRPRRDRDWKKPVLFGFLGIVAGFICFISYQWFIYSSTHISTNNSYIEADLYNVNSRMMGYVKNVLVRENEKVKKGDLIIELDDSDVQIELGYKRARYNKALADIRRARALRQSKIMSQSDLETAEATFTAVQADLEGSLLKEKFTKIFSPGDGVIVKRSVQPGQFVQPGQNLMMVVSNERPWIKANFKETQLNRVRPGLPVEVEVDAYPGEKWHGKVEAIYPSTGSNLSLIPPENATGNFTKIVQRIPVKISIESRTGMPLRPGMSTISTIVLR